MWRSLHLAARDITRKAEFPTFLKSTIESIPCPNCHKHATKYLAENSLDPYANLIDPVHGDIGYFKYMWEFHNSVNQRLGKRKLPLDEALRLFPSNKGLQTKPILIKPIKPLSRVPSMGMPQIAAVGAPITSPRVQPIVISPRHATAEIHAPHRPNIAAAPMLLKSPSGRIIGDILTRRHKP